jgi:hypothetical protein
MTDIERAEIVRKIAALYIEIDLLKKKLRNGR